VNILLDNNVSPKLARNLPGHVVQHVRDLGWTAYLNGELVRAADDRFDVLVTADKNMEFQTNLSGTHLAVAVLDCKTNRLEDLRPLMGPLLRALPALKPAEFSRIRTEA
jgi:predicted nuclease of predicted toxin-antitoxin system